MAKNLISSQVDSSTKEGKPGAYCDICQHKHEVINASNVCRQCRLFFCPACCASHMDLSPSKDHVMIELGGVMHTRNQANVPPMHKIDSMSSTASEADDNVVDSNFECKEGLSTFFKAQENACLSKIAEFKFSSDIETQKKLQIYSTTRGNVHVIPHVQEMLCLSDGRICIHNNNKIIVYSQEYHPQFATDCSPDCAVVHTDGNTIAILDYYLTIDRLNIKEKEAKLIDNVKLDIPNDICEMEATFNDMYGSQRDLAFSFGDCQYALVFSSIQYTRSVDLNSKLRQTRTEDRPPVWCIFSLAGKLLRRIVLQSCSFRSTVCVFHGYYNLNIICCDGSSRRLYWFNRYGWTKSLSINAEYDAIYADGKYIIFFTMDISTENINLVILEIETQKTRYFELPFQSSVDSVVFQKKMNRIVVAIRGTFKVFELREANVSFLCSS